MRMIRPNPHPEVTVVVPAHNEAENLPTLIAELLAAEALDGRRFEILVIDDASSDATPAVLADLAARHPQVVVRRMQWQSGQSAALAAGFDEARGEIVVTIDADLQNDPADIPKLLSALDSEVAECAIGWRRDRRDPWTKKIVSKIANGVRNWATGENVRDTGCGLKAFRAEVLKDMPRFNGMHRFFPTLAKLHGARVMELPVNHRPRTRGKTHYTMFNRFLRPMQDLLAVRWLQRRALRYQLQPEKEAALVRR
jgi:dolichol-phosphate mannosyltransferase